MIASASIGLGILRCPQSLYILGFLSVSLPLLASAFIFSLCNLRASVDGLPNLSPKDKYFKLF